jgi:hypothetical protein
MKWLRKFAWIFFLELWRDAANANIAREIRQKLSIVPMKKSLLMWFTTSNIKELMQEASDFLIAGRRMYLFTRPDGTYIAEKPSCCRRIFRETNLINSAPTFGRLKTPSAERTAWIRFNAINAEKAVSSTTTANSLWQATEDTLADVEKLLTSLNSDSDKTE